MLQSLKVGDGEDKVTVICAHWKSFPPPGAGQDAERLRANDTITEAQYNRIKLWERDCGIQRMQESKCMSCPHRRSVQFKTRGPVLVAPDGTETPVVDATTGEASPRNRHHHGIFRRPGTKGSLKPAAWAVDQDEESESDG